MKMPGKVRSMIDEMEGLSSSDKAKLVRHLNGMADSLPEHPTPAEAARIVKGALKALEIKVGKKEKADDEPKEEPKKEKDDKKEEVKESIGSTKLSFKAFLESSNDAFPTTEGDIDELTKVVRIYSKGHGTSWQDEPRGKGLLKILTQAFPPRKVLKNKPPEDVITDFTNKRTQLIDSDDSDYGDTGSFKYHDSTYYYAYHPDFPTPISISDKPFKERSFS